MTTQHFMVMTQKPECFIRENGRNTGEGIPGEVSAAVSPLANRA